MEPTKLPRMEKSEYDMLIDEGYMCRIAFNGDEHPYVAPFLYVFDGKFMYFLSSKYGKKVANFRKNPNVTVEVERYSPDLSHFAFVALPGRLVEVEDHKTQMIIRQMFIDLIRKRGLSPRALSALGQSPDEPLEALLSDERNSVWKLVGVKVGDILGLKNQKNEEIGA